MRRRPPPRRRALPPPRRGWKRCPLSPPPCRMRSRVSTRPATARTATTATTASTPSTIATRWSPRWARCARPRTPWSCWSTTTSGRCRSTGRCCSSTNPGFTEIPPLERAGGFFLPRGRLQPMRRVAILLLLAGCAGPPPETDDRSGEKPVLRAWRGTTPVLDGVIAPGEWDDATTFRGGRGWTPTFTATTDDADLSLQGWVKHDGENLYFAVQVIDDVLYGIDTPRWLPDEN